MEGHKAFRLSNIIKLGCFFTASAYLANTYSKAVSIASAEDI